jgi:hypothetical protein|tara:strand:- start:337 stop:531 length:195 start_codon:yes stop_codon:yes gene_type:complete
MKKLQQLLNHFHLQFLPEEPLLGISTETGGIELETDIYRPYWQIHFGLIFFKLSYSNIDYNSRL